RKSSPPPIRYNSVEQVTHECAALLSLIARAGHREEAAAEDAFKAGCAKLGSDVGCLGLAREAPPLSEAAEAIARLSETTPKIKKLVVEAAAAATGADGTVTIEEAELLRAVSAGLDVPVPPVFASST
nr:peptidase M48 [bacterium]